MQEKYSLIRYLNFVADVTDTDGDGMTDVFEQAYGLDPDSAADANGDLDGDGYSNLEEYLQRTNPTLSDTDGDGMADDEDNCPLDEGGSMEGFDGVCEAEYRANPVLRLIQLMNR